MKPLAKSSYPPVYLSDHIRHLIEQVAVALTPRAFVLRKYRERTGEDLDLYVRQSARWHDEGKKDPQWQNACQKDHEVCRRTGKESGANLRRVGVRHELISLVRMGELRAKAAFPVRVAVAAHHQKLSLRHEDRWQERPAFRPLWEEFFREGKSLRTSDRASFEQAIRKRYRLAGPRALLQMVDHRASASEAGDALPDFTPFAYNFPHPDKRGVQRVVEELWDEPFAILRAPTGAGKTDAALLWAQHQVESGRADRLVIAMPTRFTANALAVSAADSLSATGLYHSSAWYQCVKDRKRVTHAEQRLIDKQQELARKLETPVTVTTIDHLCISLTGTREDHHSIFFSLAHSCVVIDEADFYDAFTQQNIVVLLRALRELNVPVLLMSATVPESARQLYAASGFDINRIHGDLTDYERPRCKIHRYGAAQTPDDVEPLLRRALKGEPTIIYANTVNRAQDYYRWFQGNDFEDVVLYHSRFTEPHKVEKEGRLRQMLGREAWASGNAHGVAILTQIGEISVNISADLMISDACPVDRLAQRAGRLSRFKERADGKREVIGELFIVEPQHTDKETGLMELYPAPYGTYANSKGWEANPSLIKSLELLRDGEYSAKTFVDLVNQLYPQLERELPHVRKNRLALEDAIVLNWLLLPKERVQDDEEDTKDWKSRDIPFQNLIIADFDWLDDDTHFPHRSDWRAFLIKHGIQIYSYQYHGAIKDGALQQVTFQVSEDSEPIYVVRPQFYDSNLGLHFDGDVNED